MSLYDDISTEDFGGWSLGATAKPSPQLPSSSSGEAATTTLKQSPGSTTTTATPKAPVIDPAIAKERSQLAAVATAAAMKRAAAESASKQQRATAAVPDIRKVADASELPIRFNALTGKLERGLPASSTSPFQSDFSISFTGVADEYDPAKPNDYEDVLRKRERERAAQKAASESSSRRRRRSGSEGGSSGSDSDSDNRPRMGSTPLSKGAAIAPPRVLLEDDLKPQAPTEEMATKPGVTVGSVLGLSSGGSGGGGGGTIASRIMAKMGYKAGQGLGRQEQGMSRALQVEKTSLRGGRIIHEDDVADDDDKAFMPPPPPPPVIPKQQQQDEVSPVTSTTELLKTPSKVVVLRNMVGHGEVDDQLEVEVTEECQKYGRVVKCLVFELPNARDDEAVRIFLEFDRQEAATKALIDLNGRFFGGRNVRANFYSVDKFRAFDLAEPLA